MKIVYPCLRRMKLKDIRKADWNPRLAPGEGAANRLRKSIKAFGNLQPLIFNIRTKTLIGGHQRLEVYQERKMTETDVWCVDVPAEKERAAAVVLNKPAGEFDPAMLVELLKSVMEAGEISDIEIVQFPADEVRELLALDLQALQPSKGPRGGLGSGKQIEGSKDQFTYNLIFPNEEQYQRWQKYLEYLNRAYPDSETIAERLIADIS